MAFRISVGKDRGRSRLRRMPHVRPSERLIQLALALATWSSVIALGAVFGELLLGAVPAFTSVSFLDLIAGTVWNPAHPLYPLYGIVPLVVGTMLVALGAAAIAIPIGLGCSIWLAELASPRIKAVFKPAIEVLSGVPSVIFGFFALVVLSQWIYDLLDPTMKLNALNGAIMLAVMMLPIMITMAEDAMSSVPMGLKEASLALGATRWETVRGVVLPSALSGIVAAMVLAFGRAVGETMTVLMATGNTPVITSDYLRSVQTMAAAIAIDFGEVEFYSVHYHVLFAVGLVLFIITFAINLLAEWVVQRYKEAY